MEIKDIVKDIVLPFLPAKTLIRFRSVSKEWDRWIRSPFLAHQQSYYFKDLSGFFCQYDEMNPTFMTLNNSAYGVPTPSLRFLPELVNIISSCNGLLLCQGRGGNNSYYICNPANEEWMELPPPGFYHGSEPATVLAFEPSALNFEASYQLICAVTMLDQPVVFFEIYSSTTRSWRISDTTFLELEDSSFTGNGFYMKGIAYWETSTRKVLAFDLKNEVYEIISLPSDTPSSGVLTQIHGELCYVGISKFLDNEYSIMIYTGLDLSLKHLLNVNLEQASNLNPGYRVLPCVDGNTVMILIGCFIYSYSMRDQRIKVIRRATIDSCSAAHKYLAYVNSLVHVA
ncbi:hypothetical protein Pfo_007684 [Paulownia fortunei]|nr:hypothetical protein Pfo_007684 [Paulownia fortunei]